MSEFKEIAIKDVHIPERLRAVDEDHALAISASIVEHGLFNPITVRKTPNGKAKYTLVAGAHRIRAMELCDDTQIDAAIINSDKDEAVLIEVCENLIRNDLSALDRAIFVQTYRDVWESKFGAIKTGPNNENSIRGKLPLIDTLQEEASRGFATVCAERLGVSKDAIKRATRIAQNLTPAVRKSVQGTLVADNQSQLLTLAKLEPKDQKKIAVALGKTKGDFKQSMTLLKGGEDQKPDPQLVLFDRLIDTWSRANDETKAKFLAHIKSAQEKRVVRS